MAERGCCFTSIKSQTYSNLFAYQKIYDRNAISFKCSDNEIVHRSHCIVFCCIPADSNLFSGYYF